MKDPWRRSSNSSWVDARSCSAPEHASPPTPGSEGRVPRDRGASPPLICPSVGVCPFHLASSRLAPHPGGRGGGAVGAVDGRGIDPAGAGVRVVVCRRRPVLWSGLTGSRAGGDRRVGGQRGRGRPAGLWQWAGPRWTRRPTRSHHRLSGGTAASITSKNILQTAHPLTHRRLASSVHNPYTAHPPAIHLSVYPPVHPSIYTHPPIYPPAYMHPPNKAGHQNIHFVSI